MSRFLGILLVASSLFAGGAAAQVTSAALRNSWLGCYDLAMANPTGKAEAYGTFVLDTVPATRLPGRLMARVIGAMPLSRPGWIPVSSDTLSLAVYAIDSGIEIVLVRTSPDSLTGTVSARGMTDTSFVRQVWARRRAPCLDRIPPQVAALMPTPVPRGGPFMPTTKPEWIDADSLIQVDASGKRFTRNVALLSFGNVPSTPRRYIVQALGGVVIGALPAQPNALPNSPVYIVWLEDGGTLRDIERIIARVIGRPEVVSAMPWFR